MAGRRTFARSAIALLVVLVVPVGVIVVARSGTSGSETSASCDGGDKLTGTLPKGDVRLAPFARDSPWKKPLSPAEVPDGAAGTVQTQSLHLGIDDGSIHTWMNGEEYSLPVVQADVCDPVVTIEEDHPSPELDGVEVRIPADANAAQGMDQHLMVIQPDNRTVIEIWAGKRLAVDRWKVGRIEVVDLEGSGVGPNNGVRAYGGSAMGGLIRKWEVDPSDPNFTDGIIRHPLAMAVPAAMLRYDGGEPGYDANGYGTSLGYVAPATEQDYNAGWTYYGSIPMGSKVALPPSVDIASLDLPPAVRSVAIALQQYGAYITDRTGDGTVAFYAEPTVPSNWLEEARGPSLSGEALSRVRALLVVVP
jgi:hypothetical protein